MKAFERIFLYSVLAILVFYVFLADNNAESQVVIQEEIRARRIVIVNDEGRNVILMEVTKDDNGQIIVKNKNDIPVVVMGAEEYDNGVIIVTNKNNIPAVGMIVSKNGGGAIVVYNKKGNLIGRLP
jgi:hypothetical protein